MGVEWKDCGHVAELIGTKLVINEFIAYEKLADIIRNRETCTAPYISVSLYTQDGGGDSKNRGISTVNLWIFIYLSHFHYKNTP